MDIRMCRTLAALIAIAVIAAGCGGDDDPSTTAGNADEAPASADAPGSGNAPDDSGKPDGAAAPVETSSLSKAALAKRARAACRRTRKGLSRVEENYLLNQTSQDLSQAERLADMIQAVLLPRIEAEIEATRKAGAPAGDEQQVEAILAAQRQAVEEVAGLEEMTENEDLEAPFAEADRLRRAYGFPVCDYIP